MLPSLRVGAVALLLFCAIPQVSFAGPARVERGNEPFEAPGIPAAQVLDFAAAAPVSSNDPSISLPLTDAVALPVESVPGGPPLMSTAEVSAGDRTPMTVPLPPAVWPGMATVAAIVVGIAIRHRRWA